MIVRALLLWPMAVVWFLSWLIRIPLMTPVGLWALATGDTELEEWAYRVWWWPLNHDG